MHHFPQWQWTQHGPPSDQQAVRGAKCRSRVLSIISPRSVTSSGLVTAHTLLRSHRRARHGDRPEKVTVGAFMKLLKTVPAPFLSFPPLPLAARSQTLHRLLYSYRYMGGAAYCWLAADTVAYVISSSDESTSGGNDARCTMKKPQLFSSRAMEVRYFSLSFLSQAPRCVSSFWGQRKL